MSYILIQSKKTIKVTNGVTYVDTTNPNSRSENPISIRPSWQFATVLIKAGQHAYPKEIAEWPTIKALQKDKILTIGQEVDENDEEYAELIPDAKAAEAKLEDGKDRQNQLVEEQHRTTRKRKGLEEVADIKEGE